MEVPPYSYEGENGNILVIGIDGENTA